MILNSPFITGSITVTNNVVASGSLTVLGTINGAVTGSVDSASYAAFAATANSASYALTSTSGSYAFAATSASQASNANTATSSSFANTATSASQAANAVTSSYAANADLLDGIDSTRFAVTSSNTFTGTQYVSATNNATSFNSTASVYTDGGLRVTKDAYVSGTIYVNNLTVYGTQSINYITSSQLNIGTNIITVNTDVPAIRFGGLAVYDSGSTRLTGSMLWDSEDNHWVYSNPSGSSYDGGMMLSGPRNSSGLGNEQGVNNNAILKGQGGDHVTSSLIIETGNATTFYTNALYVTSSNFVGVGTTSPSYSLDISNVGRSIATTRLYGNDQANVRLRLENIGSGGRTWEIVGGLPGANNTNFSIYDVTSTATRFNIDSTGAATFASSVTTGGQVAITSGFGTSTSAISIYNNTASNASNIAQIDFRVNNTFGGNERVASITALNPNASANNGGALVFSVSANGTATTPTEDMRITSTGELLISRTSSVNGGTNFALQIGNGSADKRLLIDGNTVYQIGVRNATNNVFYFGADTSGNAIFSNNAGSELIRITTGGDLLVGTTSSAYSSTNRGLIVVNGATNALYGLSVGGTNKGYLYHEGTNAYLENSVSGGFFSFVQVGAGYFSFTTNASERMRITSGGNIGIGTSSPNAKLQVETSDNNIAVFNSGNVNGGYITLRRGGNDFLYIGNSSAVGGGANNTDFYTTAGLGMRFFPNASSAALVLTTSGNVGIGTTSPGKRLEIYEDNSSTTSTTGLKITNFSLTTNARTGIVFQSYDNNGAAIWSNRTGSVQGELFFGVNSGGGTAESNIIQRLKIAYLGFTASVKGASDSESKIVMDAIGNPCGLIPTPAGTTLYLYNRDGGTNYRVLLTSSTYFTGQHGNKPIDSDLKTNIQNYIGMIVSSAGSYYSVNPINQEVTTGKDAIQISEALPEVKLTDTDQDKAVWGVVTNVKNDNHNTDGTVETDNNTDWGDRLGSNVIRINGLGEGAIWVTNINGNIENGDYVCSSVIPGYGRKQNDDLLHNYTVAKSTMDCDFDLNNDDLYVCEEFQHNGTTYKKAFIGCTYHCS